MRTLRQNCEQTLQNCEQTELWTNWRFWIINFRPVIFVNRTVTQRKPTFVGTLVYTCVSTRVRTCGSPFVGAFVGRTSLSPALCFTEKRPFSEQLSEFQGILGATSEVHSQPTIRNARITILIPLEYFDVMYMKSLRKIIRPEFSDVMIAYVVGGEARDANRQITRNNSARFFDVNQDEIITRNNSLKIKWWNVILEFPMVIHAKTPLGAILGATPRIGWRPKVEPKFSEHFFSKLGWSPHARSFAGATLSYKCSSSVGK